MSALMGVNAGEIDGASLATWCNVFRAVSVKVRKGRKKVIIKEESKDDEVYNKQLAIKEAEEADNNDIVSGASVIYHSDADQGYGEQFKEEEEEDDEEDETDTNIDWSSSHKDHDISSIASVKKVEDDMNNQKAKPKCKSYVATKKQILLAPPGESFDEAMAEYLKNPPNKCGVMSGLIELLNPSHKQLLLGYMMVKWAKPIPWKSDIKLHTWNYTDFIDSVPLQLNTFKNALIIGTKSVKKLKGDNPVDSSSSKGHFMSSNWSLSKNGGNISAPKSNFALLGSIEVPIYNGTALDIDWDKVGRSP
ncbi:hypothetical protein M422DRAFT_248665 [Sphaerobolus stellatus SS14]|nr:hypothetical protein M422DRAFT_248665 [Sphaerobolus stellatus SS14]